MKPIDKIIEIAEVYITRYTLQLFKLKSNEFCPFGTGVLLNFNETYWLITASHITDSPEDDDLYFQHKPNDFLSIAGECGESDLKINKKIDFATIHLEDECVKGLNKIKYFLDINKTCKIQDQFDKQTLIACGFPAILTDNSSDLIISHGEYILTNTTNKKPYIYYDFNPEHIIIVELSGKRTNLKTKQKTKSNEPYGMSGGGLWKIWIEDNEWMYGLVGILTEFRKARYHVMIANKIELALDIIHEKMQSGV